MCIRDSFNTALTPFPKARLQRQNLALGAALPACKQNGILPVSYTHLRAHETVLDLVCRLLLEKKKHNISPTVADAPHT